MSAPPRVKPVLLLLYKEYLGHQDVDRFIGEVSRWYNEGTLMRLAQHPAQIVRRAAVMALGFLGTYECNRVLGEALRDSHRGVRVLAEEAIRKVWLREGTPEQQRELKIVARLNAAQHYKRALNRVNRLLKAAPHIAEAWNQRAIANFGLERYREATADCNQALELNPYHFAAASGMGYAYLQLGEYELALESFRRALRLNPDLEAVRLEVARLQKKLDEQKE